MRTLLGACVAAAAMLSGVAALPTAAAAVSSRNGKAVVKHADLDGNGSLERIRIRRHSNGARVTARLDGQRISRQCRCRTGLGRCGSAPLRSTPARRGARPRLHLGRACRVLPGAHPEDRLRREENPGRSDGWAVDSAYEFSVGVWRHKRHGKVTVVLRSVTRNRSGEGFHGRDVSYRWRARAWDRVGARKRHYDNDEEAYAISGWHVVGLPRFA